MDQNDAAMVGNCRATDGRFRKTLSVETLFAIAVTIGVMKAKAPPPVDAPKVVAIERQERQASKVEKPRARSKSEPPPIGF